MAAECALCTSSGAEAAEVSTVQAAPMTHTAFAKALRQRDMTATKNSLRQLGAECSLRLDHISRGMQLALELEDEEAMTELFQLAEEVTGPYRVEGHPRSGRAS